VCSCRGQGSGSRICGASTEALCYRLRGPSCHAADRALLSGRVVRILQDHSSLLALAGSGYLAFSEWTSTFTAPPLCAAIVDRFTFDAHVINTGTDSYRLYTAKPQGCR
jgi:hypothetical protein